MHSHSTFKGGATETHPVRQVHHLLINRHSARGALAIFASWILTSIASTYLLFSAGGFNAEHTSSWSHLFPPSFPSQGDKVHLKFFTNSSRSPASESSRRSIGRDKTEGVGERKDTSVSHSHVGNSPQENVSIFFERMINSNASCRRRNPNSGKGRIRFAIACGRTLLEKDGGIPKDKTKGTAPLARGKTLEEGKLEKGVVRSSIHLVSGNEWPGVSSRTTNYSRRATTESRPSPPLRSSDARNNGVITYRVGHVHENGDNVDLDKITTRLDDTSIERPSQRRYPRGGEASAIPVAAYTVSSPGPSSATLIPTHYEEGNIVPNHKPSFSPVTPLQVSFLQQQEGEMEPLSKKRPWPLSVGGEGRAVGLAKSVLDSHPFEKNLPVAKDKPSGPADRTSLLRKSHLQSLQKFYQVAQEAEKQVRGEAEALELKKSISNDPVSPNKVLERSNAEHANTPTKNIIAPDETKQIQPRPHAPGVSGTKVFSYFCCVFGGVTILGALYLLIQLQKVTKELSGVKKFLILTNEMPFVVV